MPPADKKLVRLRFSRSLRTYDEAAAVQLEMAQRLCQELKAAEPVRNFAEVLELGCGTGLFTALLERTFQCAHLTLIDLVPEFAACHTGRRADFIAGDLDEVEFPAADLVVSNAALQWSANLPRVMAKVAAALPVGGKFGFTTFAAGTLPELSGLIAPRVRYETPQELKEMLVSAGFAECCLVQESRRLRFESFRALLRHFKATGVAGGEPRRWTRRDLAELEADYRRRNPGGTFELTYKPLIVVAEKG